MSEPTIRRKFVLFDPTDNHNKMWMIEWWSETGQAKTTWGRIDVSQQAKAFTGWTQDMVENKIGEKRNKGYTEVSLHVPTVAPVVTTVGPIITDKRVADLLDLIFREAGEHIKSYMAVGVDALSVDQLAKGKAILNQLIIRSQVANKTVTERLVIADLVKQFYNTVPTQLPNRIDAGTWERLVAKFLSDLNEQETRLDQLEAGLAAYQAASTGHTDYMSQLGDIELAVMEQSSIAYGTVADYILRTSGGHYHLSGLFSVNIKSERAAFDADTVGRHYINPMFHGTRSPNVRHILRTGLIIPRAAANGSRFGRGIYFADRSQRSLNYCGGRDRRKFLFVADVALGTMKQLDGDDQRLTAAPAGHDSVRGIKSFSGMDEFIIYRPMQATIRCVALVE